MSVSEDRSDAPESLPRPATGNRHKARVIALQVLYEVDSVGHDPDATLARHLEQVTLSAELAAFARAMVRGTLGQRAAIDELIARKAPAWPLDQMAKIDKNILRLAIFELLYDNEVPAKAAINEAVELAKTFGSANSPKFVNGVLGAVVGRPGAET